ncbi:unnamed protein product [Peniophora sp. CBMAI 1063]|nr:unnamed protein product [Peniophora sp. CBMAI 1063]
MFSTQFSTLVILAAGLSTPVSAAPASVKRSDAALALAAREPQLNTTLPNQLPIQGVLPFDITITPEAQNTTVSLPAGFPFKRDLEARQFNTTLPNQLPVQGVLPFDITLTPGAQNTTVGLPSGFPFKRGLEARQFNATLPNQLPVEGVLPFDNTLTPGAQNTTVGLPSNFPFKFKRDDDDASNSDDIDDGVFNFTRNAHLPLWTKIPIGLFPENGNITDSDNTNDTDTDTSGGFPFVFWGDEGDDSEQDLSTEKRQFNFTLPNRLPVEGALPFGLNVTTGERNSTVGLPSGFPF